MKPTSIHLWLVGIAVAIAVPGIGCFGFYTLQYMGEAGARWATLVVLAYPLALIGLTWLVATVFSPHRTKLRLLASALCFAAPALFLLLVRLQAPGA